MEQWGGFPCEKGGSCREMQKWPKGEVPRMKIIVRKVRFPGFWRWLASVTPRMMLTTHHPSNVDDFHP